MEDLGRFCEYMRMPYAKFELINFYTLVDAMLNFEHESRVPKASWMEILANLIG